MHGFVDDFYCMFLCADAARAVIAPPMIAPATLGYRAQKVCYSSDTKCIALKILLPQRVYRARSRQVYTSSVVCSIFVVGVLLLYPVDTIVTCSAALPSASDVGFGAAGVEKAAGGRLPHAHWGNGRPGGEANVRNRRDVRLPIEAHAALRHAL